MLKRYLSFIMCVLLVLPLFGGSLVAQAADDSKALDKLIDAYEVPDRPKAEGGEADLFLYSGGLSKDSSGQYYFNYTLADGKSVGIVSIVNGRRKILFYNGKGLYSSISTNPGETELELMEDISISEALGVAGTMIADEGLIIPSGDNVYMLVFPEDAKSLKDLEFVVKTTDFVISEEKGLFSPSEVDSYNKNHPLFEGDKNAKFSVTLLDVLHFDADDATEGGRFRFDWDLGYATKGGEVIDTEEETDVIGIVGKSWVWNVDGSMKGSSIKEIGELENDTYTFYIETTAGARYYCDYTVEYVSSDWNMDSGRNEDEIYADGSKGEIPEVTVKIPNVNNLVEGRDSCDIIISADVNSKFSIKGTIVNSDYAKSVSYTVYENGTYSYYVVSEDGESYAGEFVVDFFISDAGAGVSDSDSLGSDLIESDNLGTATLVQTGLHGLWLLVLGTVLSLSGVGLFIYSKRMGLRTKNMLVLLLVCGLLVDLVGSHVTVFALSGSQVDTEPPSSGMSGSGPGGDYGFVGDDASLLSSYLGYRITMSGRADLIDTADISDDAAKINKKDYMKFEALSEDKLPISGKNKVVGKVKLAKDITNCKRYGSSTRWVYILPDNNVANTSSYYFSNGEKRAAVDFWNNVYDEVSRTNFCKLFGWKKDNKGKWKHVKNVKWSDFSVGNIESVFQNTDPSYVINDGVTIDGKKYHSLTEFFELEGTGTSFEIGSLNCYFVVERIIGYVSSVYTNKGRMFTTYQGNRNLSDSHDLSACFKGYYSATMFGMPMLYKYATDISNQSPGMQVSDGVTFVWDWDDSVKDETARSKYFKLSCSHSNCASVRSQACKSGYAVYADPFAFATARLSKDKVGMNIIVEYQGEPNTSDETKFVVDSSVIRFDDKDGKKLSYYDTATSKFVESTDKEKLLGIKNVSTGDSKTQYKVHYTGTYSYTLREQNRKISTLIDAALRANKSGSGFTTKDGDKKDTSYTLTWGEKLVEGGSKNFGVEYYPKSFGERKTTGPIRDRFWEIVWNKESANGCEQSESTNFLETTDDHEGATGSKILDACLENFVSGTDRFDGKMANDTSIAKDEKFGLSIEFIIKGSKVGTRKFTYEYDFPGKKVKPDPNGKGWKTWGKYYPSTSHEEVDLTNGVFCYVVTNEDNSIKGGDIPELIKGCTTKEQVFEKLKKAFEDKGKTVKADEFSEGGATGQTIFVGCEGKDDDGDGEDDGVQGYYIYEVVGEKIDPPDEVVPSPEGSSSGKLNLPAYMLNIYYNDAIQTSSGNTVKWTLKKDWTHNPDADGFTTIPCNKSKVITTVGENWKIKYKDISTGTEFGYDTGSKGNMRMLYYPKSMSSVWPNAEREILKDWFTQDSKTGDGKIFDYAFNLIREASGDKRSISGISHPNYVAATGDSKNMLRISGNFGVVPKEVKTIGTKRNSKGVVTTWDEKWEIDVQYEQTNSKSGEKDPTWNNDSATTNRKSDWTVHSQHKYHDGCCPPLGGCSGLTCPKLQYVSSFQSWTISAFRLNGAAKSNNLKHTITNTVYKYQTEDIDDGKNTKIGDAAMIPIDTHHYNPAEGSVGGTNEYRFATIHYNGVTDEFFPEVKMAFKIGGTTFDTSPYKAVYTMAEIKRKAKSSSLFLFKFNGTGDGSITGTTYSDAMQGGSSILGNKNVTIPAGADVTVLSDPHGITIDLYGYALDIIDKSVDTTMKTGASSTMAYNTVVKSGANVYQEWMGSSHLPELKQHFIKWTDDILDVRNFEADFELWVDGVNTSENFSATVGEIEHQSTCVEDGVYQLVVENGELQKSKGAYQKMLEQIKADYELTSTAQADDIFEASGMYTAILEAIESSVGDDFNKSGVANPLADTPTQSGTLSEGDWTNSLGKGSNWYDEKVYTFVVRRFTNKGNVIKDIVAQDKIDYGLAPNSNSSNKQNSNAGKNRSCKWYLNLFFNSAKKTDVDKLLLGNSTYYLPTNGAGGVPFDTANNAHSVMINKAYVQNADFLIPAQSSSEFGK